MVKPEILQHKPSRLLAVLGGIVGTVLLSALLYISPLFGFPFIDMPRLAGGIVTGDPEGAFWLGVAIFFIGGVLVFAPALCLAWWELPGPKIGFPGAAVKGIVWGLILWVLSGLILPLAGLLNQVQGLQNPGFFGLSSGILAALGILIGHLIYGLALALVLAMGYGIKPFDTFGWKGFGYGDLRQVAIEGKAKAYSREDTDPERIVHGGAIHD